MLSGPNYWKKWDNNGYESKGALTKTLPRNVGRKPNHGTKAQLNRYKYFLGKGSCSIRLQKVHPTVCQVARISSRMAVHSVGSVMRRRVHKHGNGVDVALDVDNGKLFSGNVMVQICSFQWIQSRAVEFA
ncbi:hypothetical protein Ancab_024476 [Ancistrocladus abbreviatus]